MAENHPHWHDDIVKLLDGVRGAVEATSFEQFALWHENHYADRLPFPRKPLSWMERNPGLLIVIGEINKLPVSVSLRVVDIDGKAILFYNSPSRITDSQMLGEWIRSYLPKTAFNPRRNELNMTDAMNFHNVLHGISDVHNSENKQENAHTG